MKKLIILGVMLMVGLWMAPDAMAARVRNTNTGKDSKNTATVVNIKSARVRTLNLGFVANVDLVGVNTGGNTANKNTGCCGEEDNCPTCGCGLCDTTSADPAMNKVTSGDGAANVTTNDTVNDIYVDIMQTDSAENDQVENSCTGQGSTNVAKVQRERNVSVSTTSFGGVINLSAVGVNTGNNTANGNTGGDATVRSGDAQATVRHTSNVNSTEVWINQ